MSWMRTSKNKIVILLIVVTVCIGVIVYSWFSLVSPFINQWGTYIEEETYSVSLDNPEHPLFSAMSNLPRNTSKTEGENAVVISQRLDDESFVVTELLWKEGSLYYGEQEIFLSAVLIVPYTFLLMQDPEERTLQFNRERTRREIFENLRNQNVMTGLYLSSQSEVDNLVIETILEGFTLISFYATEHWLYALFTRGAEDKLIWWDGALLTLAGNFRR